MNKPPIIIVTDMQTYTPEDVPDEYLEALERYLEAADEPDADLEALAAALTEDEARAAEQIITGEFEIDDDIMSPPADHRAPCPAA